MTAVVGVQGSDEAVDEDLRDRDRRDKERAEKEALERRLRALGEPVKQA